MDPLAGLVKIWDSKSVDDPLNSNSETPVMQYQVAGAQNTFYRVLATCVWSLDGNFLYVMHMDGSVAKMVVRIHLLDVQ